jgi:4-hydroxyphenylpyruvate dioxygenase-like putative hemolysin
MLVPKLRLLTTNQNAKTNYQTLPMGIRVANGRYIEPGAIVTTQTTASSLPTFGFKKTDRSLTTNKSLFEKSHLRLVVNNC